ncbi:MAG: Type I restriction-modification system restriction subunit [Candidatus Wolfebacteria bacterium GW2011_GWC2_46_275]|uniref:Type I restriction enzyme endonuclease subunit n=1 Tax=Candidatus Wolfebacteria bacterium GW2011_GWB1_47_1 TaxID=1619007 RepID=A0A0G4ARJ9_9BACT|nr:MAG: type I restriction-modification system restriction subunit, type I restriction enzyme, R subunit [Candidatus Wolfebacteria bacterium GW2011_GWB1_47_1]KKU36431.1 MAG: Type I restriction-modification system restriction subunit [Candidatus Wolfebacteria bacterium GW2011_GWC2_46_275]KKU41744.1 MAG: Type I restriction-modification system restriction subunit [Candidatus Wolfebacteria bacterium GW2011_GWB2_46_69]KKU53962.1 MAG: type I restriction-modification system restriction subunit, type I 
MTKIYENDIELWVIEILEKQGYAYLSPDDQEIERPDLREVILRGRLEQAVARINPSVSAEAREDAIKKVFNLLPQHLVESNEEFQKMLTDGVTVEVASEHGGTRGEVVHLIDFDTITNNDLVVANQFTIPYDHTSKRPDVVLLVNGLPLVIIELKNATDENATVHKAFTQLQNYKDAVPQLFVYNGILIASDGLDARVGSLTAPWERFVVWRAPDEKRKGENIKPQMETIVTEMLKPAVLLDLIRNFTVFEKAKKENKETGLVVVESIKKVAAYHQYYVVNKAIASTVQATEENGERKIGVVWHTQGSGKSLSMVFYTGKVVLALNNPTIVVITDRNDLDDQLFETFAGSRGLLRQDPVQAESRTHLKELLQTAGGGIVFTTIQKFFPEDGGEVYDQLTERKNIVVIADEAHRSQYGFAARTVFKDEEAITRYGNAKYLRDALPNASFIGFTGTPIESEDKSTPAVFGGYLDVYDIQDAVKDGATVPIYYESRLVKVHLPEEKSREIDAEVEAVAEGVEFTAKEKAKAKWAQLEAIVGNRERMKEIAKDLVAHFEARQEVNVGKAMVVAMSRRIAVQLYEEIVAIRPEWHSDDLDKGAIKVVMTANSSDPKEFQPHNTNKEMRRRVADRFKDPNNTLKLVVVCDMWLTGFDIPCLHTMYIDKLMRGHNLMQAIARVNRVFRDKSGGLIVDYIGFASDLQKALAVYTQSGGTGDPTITQEKAVEVMLEKYEVVKQMFHGFDYGRYFTLDTYGKLGVILEAQEHILAKDQGKETGSPKKKAQKPQSAQERFTHEVTVLSKIFAIAVPHEEALAIRGEVAFFQAIKARLIKFDPNPENRQEDIETAIRQIVDKAIVAEGVVDIFAAAGIQKPDLSVLSDDFLAEVKGMKHQNVAMELLKRILNDEIKGRLRKNFIQGKKLSEMLEKTIKKYQNNLLTAAEVIQELIELAKEIRIADARGEDLGLSDDELAFYDALANNESAREVMDDATLREIARVLVEKVRSGATVDWTIRENVKAKLRVLVRRTLTKFGYPPDKQLIATETILKQAELFADDWVS